MQINGSHNFQKKWKQYQHNHQYFQDQIDTGASQIYFSSTD